MKSKSFKQKAPSKQTIIKQKLGANQRKLEELYAYKNLLKEDGILPDARDKELESKLVIKKLRLEKQLAACEDKNKPVKGRAGTQQRSQSQNRRPVAKSPASKRARRV